GCFFDGSLVPVRQVVDHVQIVAGNPFPSYRRDRQTALAKVLPGQANQPPPRTSGPILGQVLHMIAEYSRERVDDRLDEVADFLLVLQEEDGAGYRSHVRLTVRHASRRRECQWGRVRHRCWLPLRTMMSSCHPVR